MTLAPIVKTHDKPSPPPFSHLELVKAAVLAPSPDNNQPWQFFCRGEQLDVCLDRQRALPSDVGAMFDLIGLGAAVENICIAAREKGYEPHVVCKDVSADSADPTAGDTAATMTFTAGAKADPLFSHLADRCTCRKLFSTRPVSAETLEKLAGAASRFAEVQLHWITDRPRIRAVARLVAATDRIRFEYEPFHNELFRQLRFSVEEVEKTQDGLDLRTLALPPGAGWMLRQLRPWKRMKWVHRLGLGRLLTLPSALSVRKSGALGVVSVAEAAAASFLKGGRAIQRIWLTARAEGLSLHPLGSLPIFLAHVQQLGGQRLSPRHTDRVRRVMRRFAGLVPSVEGRIVLLLFRLGYSSPPRFRSLRRPAEDVLYSEETA